MQPRDADPPPPLAVAVASTDRVYRQTLIASLRREGLVVRGVDLSAEARSTLDDVEVLVLDTTGMGAAELERITRLRQRSPLVEVVAIAGESPVAEAVRALRTGVFTVLQHPASGGELDAAIVGAGLRHRRAQARLRELNGRWRAGPDPEEPDDEHEERRR